MSGQGNRPAGNQTAPPMNDGASANTGGVASYTLPGVLHYLQVEWRKFEKERNQWEIEKSDLKARIAFLEGERRGMENLRTDLLRRIKMLEYALRQERNKIYKLQQERKSASPTPGEPISQDSKITLPVQTSTDIGPTMPENVLSAPSHYGTLNLAAGMGTLLNYTKGYGHMRSKEILKNYLREMGVLVNAPGSGPNGGTQDKSDVQANEAGFGMEMSSDMETAAMLLGKRESARIRGRIPTARPIGTTHGEEARDEIGSDTNRNVGKDAVDITVQQGAEESVPAHENASRPPTADANDQQKKVPTEASTNDEAAGRPHIAQNEGKKGKSLKGDDNITRKEASDSTSEDGRLTQDEMKELKLTPEKVNKVMHRLEGKNAQKKKSPGTETKTASAIPSVVANTMSLDGDALATLTLSEEDVEEGSKKKGSAKIANQKLWRPKAVLRNHMDSIRAIAFCPYEAALVTASEDNTAKVWNIGTLEDRHKVHSDLEPIYTFRGHTEALTSVLLSADGETCYSGSVDATIRVWRMPPLSRDPYASYQNTKQYKLHTFVGHSDVIWDMKLHPLPQQCPLLASVSSDGALKVWNTTPNQWSLRTTLWYGGANYGGNETVGNGDSSGLLNPTSVDWVYSSTNKLAVSYQNSVVKIFDSETGQEVVRLKSDETFDGTPDKQINKLVCHPTLPLLVTAHEDRYIRIFDTNTGECAHSMIAHQDAVSALDISADGLTLVSGGHDCSLRWWDLTTRKCVQEYTSHRKKNDEGIWAVRFHPEQSNCMASGGADAVCKLYTFGTSVG